MKAVEKTIVAIVVFNRFGNLQRWLKCWRSCDKQSAQLVIIHNYEFESDIKKYSAVCEGAKVIYVPRKNIGFDIGAFQDVCSDRLQGFPSDWNYLLWITDDTIPMQTDFVRPFILKLKEPGVGISAMEVSKEVVPHVRTTGFCIKREVATKLKFPADPVTTKEQCYAFEHRGGSATMIRQVLTMGYSSAAVSPLAVSPLWDIGNRRSLKLNRWTEHFEKFPELGNKITFICPVFNTYPEIISSMICQTYPNWELLLLHDGPCKTNLKKILATIGDHRIKFIESEKHVGNWGHYLRQWGIEQIKQGVFDCDFVVITNADNHHVPVYCEYFLRGFLTNPAAVAVYCNKMIHSYKAWDLIPVRLARGYVDCAGVMLTKDAACEVGWNNITDHSADWIYFSEAIKKYGASRFISIQGCLLIHN